MSAAAASPNANRPAALLDVIKNWPWRDGISAVEAFDRLWRSNPGELIAGAICERLRASEPWAPVPPPLNTYRLVKTSQINARITLIKQSEHSSDAITALAEHSFIACLTDGPVVVETAPIVDGTLGRLSRTDLLKNDSLVVEGQRTAYSIGQNSTGEAALLIITVRCDNGIAGVYSKNTSRRVARVAADPYTNRLAFFLRLMKIVGTQRAVEQVERLGQHRAELLRRLAADVLPNLLESTAASEPRRNDSDFGTYRATIERGRPE